MSDFCKNCNYQLNGSAFCPQCGTKAEREEPVLEAATAVEEPVTETITPPEQEETVTSAPPVAENVATEQPQQAYAQPVQQPQAQPSAFSMAIKQSFNVIKNFFSKNVVDAISAQHGEKLNIWIILFAIPVLLSAISACIHYASPVTDLLSFTGMPYSAGIGRFSHFISGFLYTAAFEFSFVIVVFLYSKIIKKKPLSFTSCANIVSSAFLPITVVAAGYVVLGSNLGIANVIALLMFVALLQKGLQNAYGEKGGFWVFYLVVAVAIVTFMIASLIVSAPSWITSAINSYSPYGSILDPYSLY